MVDVSSPLTLALAKAFGVYMIAGGLSGLLAPRRWEEILDGFEASPALSYFAGVCVFAFGATIVLAHNIWSDPLSILITLYGWAAAIEAVVILIAPRPLFAFARWMVRPMAIRAFAMGVIVLGVLVLAGGLFGRVSA